MILTSSFLLQLYFNKITELTLSRTDVVLFKEALVSLATDPGLHPLVPYFTCFIADEVFSSYIINNSGYNYYKYTSFNKTDIYIIVSHKVLYFLLPTGCTWFD